MAPPSVLDVPHLNGWAAQWDQLVDSSPLPSPFLRSWWLTGAGGPGRHFLLVVDGAHLIGGLALETRHPLLSIRVMGDGALCPDHLDLLAAPGHEAVVVSLLRDWLCRPGERLLDLRGIRAGSRLVEALPGRVRREPMAVAPFTPLPNSPEAYRATLPAQFRKNLRVSAKRLAAEGLAHQTIRGRAVIQRLDTLRELHQAQWEAKSSIRRAGRWQVPGRCAVLAYKGSGLLDLRAAKLTIRSPQSGRWPTSHASTSSYHRVFGSIHAGWGSRPARRASLARRWPPARPSCTCAVTPTTGPSTSPATRQAIPKAPPRSYPAADLAHQTVDADDHCRIGPGTLVEYGRHGGDGRHREHRRRRAPASLVMLEPGPQRVPAGRRPGADADLDGVEPFWNWFGTW